VDSGEDGDDNATEVSLTQRLRDAVTWANLRAGRAKVERMAAGIVAGGMARTMRLARKERLRQRATLKLREFRPQQWESPPGDSAADALGALFGAAAADAARAPQPSPDHPPEPEEETVYDEADMPRAKAAWRAERERQAATPFTAGQRGEVAFDWESPPPPPPPGKVWRWGPFACPKESPALGGLLAKEVRQTAIELVGWAGVDVVTPVFIAWHPVTGKARLVHDLRALCSLMRLSTVDYDRAADALLGGTHSVKMDLLSAFRHCALPEADRRRMGFVVGDRVWRWTSLPFGASQSPELYCAQVAVAVRRLRARGIRVVAYVDDFLILANSPEELDVAAAHAIEELASDGWNIALDKTFVTVAATVMPFLGVLVDLRERRCLRVSVKKAKKLEALCDAILDGPAAAAAGAAADAADAGDARGRRRRQVVTLRELQKLGGTLSFLATAAPIAGMMRDAIDAATAEAQLLPGRTVGLRGALREQVAFWRRHAAALPTSPAVVAGEETIAVVTDAAGVPDLGWGVVAWPGREVAPPVAQWLEAKEAKCGEVVEGAVAGFGQLRVPTAGRSSSAALEVQGFRRALRWIHARRPGCLDDRVVVWYCDAQAALGAVRKWRSPARGVAREVSELFDFCVAHRIAVRPVWVARELGWQPVADFLSRAAARLNSAEWQLPAWLFTQLKEGSGFEPVIDLFATPTNRQQCEAYVTQHPVQQGVAVDAFARPWDGVRGYAFPPFSQVGKAFRQLAAARDARVLFVLPAETSVPECLRTLWETDLPRDVRLIDGTGTPAKGACPRPLRALLLEAPTGVS